MSYDLDVFGTLSLSARRFPRDDDAKFDAMYREDCYIGDLILAGKPIEHGTIDGWTNDLERRTQSIRLKFELDRLVKLKALDAIEPFFVALAERTGCFFAFAEVNTSQYGTAQPPMGVKLKDPWSGLPTEPQWLTWFGPEYAALVAPHLDPAVDERCSKAAAVMPASLRYPAPGSPQALRIDAHYARMREIEANARQRTAEGRR